MDPENEITPGTGAPASADQLPGSQAPESPAPAEAAVELPFRLEDIGEDFSLQGQQAREWLAARQAQMQSGFTRATQTLAEQRQQLQEAADLFARLDSDDTRHPALKELLNRFGYDLPDEDDDLFEPEAPAAPNAQTDPAALARLEALEAEAESRRANEATAAYQAQVVADMHALATENGFDDAYAVPEYVRDDVLGRAVLKPRLPDGRLDLHAALAEHLQLRQNLAGEAVSREEYLRSKTDGPDPGVVDGGAGDRIAAVTTRDDRLKKALAVAGRHL